MAELTGAVRVERAVHVCPAPLGYYRLTLGGSGQRRFGKVVAVEDAGRESAASLLAGAAAFAGVPALRQLGGPAELDAEYRLFQWSWIDGTFATGSDAEMRALGRATGGLHRFLRSRGRPAADGDATWAARWLTLDALAASGRLQGPVARRLDAFLSRGREVQASLMTDAQPVHDDLHPGNVLFDEQGRVLALLDFEEALQSVGTPWIDLAWVVERFCLLGPRPEHAEDLAFCFLEAYGVTGSRARASASRLTDAILWRTYRALGVLAAQQDEGGKDAEAQAEWRKFVAISTAIDSWVPALQRLEARCAGGSGA
jgi:Ser/Thr protein kinase RdoA (MazF antagonist)